MTIFAKHRFRIYNQTQHPYKHNLSDFGFANNAVPGVSNVEAALNHVFSVIYPNALAAVADPASLPAAGNNTGDFRVVLDDGDGKQAAYRWEQREGDAAPQWYKVMDMDWSNESIIAQLMDVTLPLYVYKQGITDIDENGDPVVGTYAGQTLFGGDAANQNLTLNANSGDGVGAQTGFIQFDGNVKPLGAYDLSTAAERWQDIYLSSSAVIGDLTIATGSITDASGAISFGDENLSTTGNISGAIVTGTSLVADDTTNSMTLTPGSIIDDTGEIDFGATNLVTTGTIGGGVATLTDAAETLVFDPNVGGTTAEIISSLGEISFGDENLTTLGNIVAAAISLGLLDVDNLRLDANTISSTDVDGNIILSPNGTGSIVLLKALSALSSEFTGTVGVTGQFNADNIRIDGNTISSTDANGDIVLNPNGTGVISTSANVSPDADATHNLGAVALRYINAYLSGSISDGTNAIDMTTLLALRSTRFRDTGETQAAQAGDSLFYDAANDVWLASAPDSEISHNTISGLTTGDAGHTQFALLAGRASGQTLIGGTGATENLTLESTANAAKGLIRFSDNLVPTTSASFAGSWSGTDLGSATNLIRDVHSRGEFFGFRAENILASALPGFSGQTPGRVYFATDESVLYVDTGAEVIPVGATNKFLSDVTFDGIVTQLDTNVSSEIDDARRATWQLQDNANDFEIMHVTIKATSATNIRIITNVPLPAGSYRLIGVE